MSSHIDRHYIELVSRNERIGNVGAFSIALLIIASCATSWSRFLLALGSQVVMLSLNIAFTRLCLERLGARLEVYRTVVNQVVCSGILFPLLDWPIAVWLWLPFVGMVFDQSGGKYTLATVVLMCGLQDIGGLLYGVHWTIPAAATAMTMLAYTLCGSRLSIIRDMLLRAERQRDDLEAAHAALKAEVAARERAELELRQAQKLEAMGRLAAGVAHEVNTPLQSVVASLEFVRETCHDVLALQLACQRVAEAPREQAAAALDEVTQLAAELDTEYLSAELPAAIELASEGCARVARLVRSMRRLSGPQAVAAVDISECIETTLALARHEYALVADVHTRFDATSIVSCNAGEISQVLVNLIVNAAHAIGDVVETTGKRGTIRITTRDDDEHVVIEIADTGGGIPPAIRERVFDPFFTTKCIGRGTGQGLAISKAILERHHGSLGFTSVVGEGTTFELRLPRATAVQQLAA